MGAWAAPRPERSDRQECAGWNVRDLSLFLCSGANPCPSSPLLKRFRFLGVAALALNLDPPNDGIGSLRP
jgi:hypothetical protein